MIRFQFQAMTSPPEAKQRYTLLVILLIDIRAFISRGAVRYTYVSIIAHERKQRFWSGIKGRAIIEVVYMEPVLGQQAPLSRLAITLHIG